MVARYERVRQISAGRFGSTTLVSCAGRPAVLKTIDASRLDSAALRDDVVEDVRMLARLRHPQLLNVVEVFREGGIICIVTDYAEAGDVTLHVDRARRAGRQLERSQQAHAGNGSPELLAPERRRAPRPSVPAAAPDPRRPPARQRPRALAAVRSVAGRGGPSGRGRAVPGPRGARRDVVAYECQRHVGHGRRPLRVARPAGALRARAPAEPDGADPFDACAASAQPLCCGLRGPSASLYSDAVSRC
mmetsp:Transcript_125765/g.402545  ORF Transcript_125765/g.402545 Transcript_125765/m.402545 type:complete len:247 (+) Transcript_125765:121-861(+)